MSSEQDKLAKDLGELVNTCATAVVSACDDNPALTLAVINEIRLRVETDYRLRFIDHVAKVKKQSDKPEADKDDKP